MLWNRVNYFWSSFPDFLFLQIQFIFCSTSKKSSKLEKNLQNFPLVIYLALAELKWSLLSWRSVNLYFIGPRVFLICAFNRQISHIWLTKLWVIHKIVLKEELSLQLINWGKPHTSSCYKLWNYNQAASSVRFPPLDESRSELLLKDAHVICQEFLQIDFAQSTIKNEWAIW